MIATKTFSFQLILGMSFFMTTLWAQDELTWDDKKSDIPIFPECKYIQHNEALKTGLPESFKRSLYCSLFTCPGTPEKVSKFYRFHYTDSSLLKLHFLDGFRILRVRFEVPELDSKIEVSLYSMPQDRTKESWQFKEQQIIDKIAQKENPVNIIDQKISDLKASFAEGKISEEYLDQKIRELHVRYNILANSRSYWDYVAIGKVLATEENVLLIIQRKNKNLKGKRPPKIQESLTLPENQEPELEEEIAEEVIVEETNLQRVFPETLAKDIPYLVYPKSSLVEHRENMEEGLRHTSRKRSTYRTFFVCPGTQEKVEDYYRSFHPNLSVLKVSAFGAFRILKLKFSAQQINSQIEVALYSLIIGPESPLWDSQKTTIAARLAKQDKPIRSINREIEQLQELVDNGQLSYEILEARKEALLRRRYIMENSSSYVDLTAMDKLLAVKKNILVMTQVKKSQDDN